MGPELQAKVTGAPMPKGAPPLSVMSGYVTPFWKSGAKHPTGGGESVITRLGSHVTHTIPY